MKKLIPIILVLMLVLTGCDSNKQPESNNINTESTEITEAVTEELQKIKILEIGDKAPNFTVQLVNGESVTMSDLNDKIVLLNFWATWCGPCVNEMPAFERLKNDGDNDLVIICINCMEDKAKVDRFVKDKGYTFNIGYDEDGSIEMYYPTNGIPYTLVINKGEIAEIYIGAADADTQYNEYKNAIEECKK
jgi:Peroxiredoxin